MEIEWHRMWYIKKGGQRIKKKYKFDYIYIFMMIIKLTYHFCYKLIFRLN